MGLSGSRLEERQLSGGGSDQQGGRDGTADHDGLRRCAANRIDGVHAAADQSGGTEQQSGNAKIGHNDDVDRADDGSAHTVSDFDDAAAVAGTGHRSSAEHFCQLWRTDAADVELCGDRARERTGGL